MQRGKIKDKGKGGLLKALAQGRWSSDGGGGEVLILLFPPVKVFTLIECKALYKCVT
jgi:hypothetical protein